MAETLYDPVTIAEATEGFQEFSQRFAELAEVEESALAGILRFLRRIPAGDMAKKRELANYFQTEEGAKYTKAERKAAYDELLGSQRNRETIG